MSLREAHVVLAWAMTIANGLVGAWALAAHRFGSLRHRSLWWATGVAQLLIMLQVVLGVIALQSIEGREMNGEHLFYGFVAAFSVGLIYSYRQQVERWTYLLYGFGGLFLMGMGLRTITIPPLSP